jgi:AhpD family alkylhydroperoxidase
MGYFNHGALIPELNQGMAALRQTQPDVMQAFTQMAKAAMAPGAIDAKHKELIALAIGITQHCSGCIGFHVKALHRLGCTRAELDEMLAICTYMGGGPALMYAAETIKAWEALAPQ